MIGWVVGYAIGVTIVVVVVVLLLLLIIGARRIAGKAEEILAALHDARDNTAGLWAVADTNAAAERIVAAAATARGALEGKGETR